MTRCARLHWPTRLRNVPRMRRFLFPALLLALGSFAFAADVSLVRVWPQWRNADAFDHVREYFGGSENPGRETVLRSRSEPRAGLYFLVRVQSTESIPNAVFVIDIIRPDAPDARRHIFTAPVPAKSRVFELGLTGEDWPGGRDVHPVAWKVSLQDGSGKTLASQQSFLWEKPAP